MTICGLLNKFLKRIHCYERYFKMDELTRYIKKLFMRILLSPMKFLPLKKNRVLLVNNLSLNYSDNLKYIAAYLMENYTGKFEIFFAVKDPSHFTGPVALGMRPIKFNSLQYFYIGMTSHVLVTNSGGFSYLPLRKTQYIINTCHGGGSYKKAGIHMFTNSWLFRKDLQLSAKHTDAFMSTCTRCSETLSESLLIPRKVFWEVGMPRNDILIRGDEKLRETVREKLGLRPDEKLVLFAPTYRKPNDNYFKNSVAISYGIDVKRTCEALNQRFGGNFRFAIRFHPCVTNRKECATDGMMDLTDYEDMQELLLAADVMINDFSSSMWDFMLTGRPSFLFAIDLEHYIQTTEVYTPVSEWPFPASTNNDELERNILEFDEEKYAEDCRCHYQSLGGCETGEATKLACKRISDICYPP